MGPDQARLAAFETLLRNLVIGDAFTAWSRMLVSSPGTFSAPASSLNPTTIAVWTTPPARPVCQACQLASGVDLHSRCCVIAARYVRRTGRRLNHPLARLPRP